MPHLTGLGHWGIIRQLAVSSVAFTTLDSAAWPVLTSRFLKSVNLFSFCDNPSIVMLLYALNMTSILGCRGFVCSYRGRADFYYSLLQVVEHIWYQAADTWMNHLICPAVLNFVCCTCLLKLTSPLCRNQFKWNKFLLHIEKFESPRGLDIVEIVFKCEKCFQHAFN